MEPLQPLDAEFTQDEIMNERSRYYLKIAAGWAKFIAIVQVVVWALYSFIFLLSIFETTGAGSDVISLAVGLLILIGLWIMTASLLNFSNKIQTAIRLGDRDFYVTAFKNLRNFFLVAGIFTILFVIFFVFAFVFGISTAFY